jgi:Electron transfer DM13
MLGRLVRKPLTWVIVGLLAVGGAVGLYWFQPWKLVTDERVNETPPAVAAPTGGGGSLPGSAGPAVDHVIATGTFVSHEHTTTGTARLTELTDGRRVLTLENLDTSNGPDLRVWLTDRPVGTGPSAWTVFDDGKCVELGRLKGNKGTQNYDVPAGLSLAEYHSVTIWCKRFSVSFGAVELSEA